MAIAVQHAGSPATAIVCLSGFICSQIFFPAILNVLGLYFGNMLAGLKTIGKGTSSSVMPTSHIPLDISPNSGPPKWVSKFVPLFWHMHSLAVVV